MHAKHLSVAALPLMAACGVGSVSPLVSDADVRFEQQLLGTYSGVILPPSAVAPGFGRVAGS
jgi:hypothetical protein